MTATSAAASSASRTPFATRNQSGAPARRSNRADANHQSRSVVRTAAMIMVTKDISVGDQRAGSCASELSPVLDSTVPAQREARSGDRLEPAEQILFARHASHLVNDLAVLEEKQ